MTFARRVFLTAGLYGLIVLTPQLFLEEKIAITHPEYYYGFLGVAIAWQVAFLIVARDPAKLRPIMIAAILEKASFAVAVPVLWLYGRVPASLLAFAGIDAVLGLLFAAAYLRTAPPATPDPRYRLVERPARVGETTDVLLLDLGFTAR